MRLRLLRSILPRNRRSPFFWGLLWGIILFLGWAILWVGFKIYKIDTKARNYNSYLFTQIMKNTSVLSIFCILICLLFFSTAFLVTTDDNDTISPSIAFLNRLFSLQNLPFSPHPPKCLNQVKYQQDFAKMVYEFARNGSYASSGLLPKILGTTIQKANKTLPINIVNCLAGSNDIKILLHHYNITHENVYTQFQTYSKANFLNVHYAFTNMTAIFSDLKINQTERYEKVAEIVHQLALMVYTKYGTMTDDPWTLRVQNVEKLDEYYGISVSNGVLGVVSSRWPLKLQSSVLAGAYDKIGRGRVDNLVQTFPALNMELYFNGRSDYNNYVQQLNMKEGSMTHSLSSSQISLQYTYYTLQNLPNVFYTKFTVVAHEAGTFVAKNLHDAPDTLIDLQKNQEDIDTAIKVFHLMSSEGKTKTGKLTLVSASTFQFEGPEPTILHEDWNSGTHLQKFKVQMKKGDKLTFSVITCLMSSQNHEDPTNQAIRLVIRASSMSNIIAGHIKKWSALWQSDIIIQGNDVDQKYVRTMLYHCYSFINGYKSYGLSPMGLSGLGYNGHVFWDMDLWIYPAILILKPSLARSLINYRFERLEAARQNAFLNGYKGAMFPWQSSKSGNEETPVWALSGPLEHHISGCVAFGAWNYYLVTQDKQWLIEKGNPIIQQVAQFFQSRVQLGQDGMYHINNVVGADEWAENIDDNAFTNGVAKVALQIANKVLKLLGLPINPKWDQISQKIVILKMPNGVTKQHKTYNGENIKQADANLLSFPLNLVTKPEDILKDLQYYEVRVPDGGTPAMTYSIFTLLYSKLKNSTMAYKNFKQSFIPFSKKPFGVFAETKGGTNPYFLTGAGGVLQSMIFGFGGFNIGDQGIYMTNNSIPVEWKKVTIKTQTKVHTIINQTPESPCSQQ